MVAGQMIPQQPLRFDFVSATDARVIEGYLGFCELLDIAHADKGNSITVNQWRNGTTLVGFDCSASNKDSSSFELVKEGQVTLHANFATAVGGQGIEVVIYAEYDNLISLDRNREWLREMNVRLQFEIF